MGDFERTFGAGADVEAIIDGFSRDYYSEMHAEAHLPRREPYAAALAAGLLDPAVADLVRKASPAPKTKTRKSKAAKTASAPAQGGSQAEPATKKRPRSVSRPAMHPTLSAGPAGDGRFDLDQDDRIIAADFTFDLVPVPKERARVVRNHVTDTVVGYPSPRRPDTHAQWCRGQSCSLHRADQHR